MATKQLKDSQTFAGQLTPGISLVSYPTPSIRDILISEIVDTHQPSYQALDYGTPYPDTINFPNHVLVKQHPRSYEYIERIYASQRVDEDAYNYGITYQNEDTTKPIFSRTYYVKRSTYSPLTTAVALTGVTRIDVTNGGSGYSSSASVTITGTHTVQATAIPHIVNGIVDAIYVTNEGSGYTTAPSIAIVDSTGIGASAASVIQGPGIYLTKEVLLERNDSDPIETIYGKVQRLYETLPGSAITSYRIDKEMGTVISTTKTKVLSGTITTQVIVSNGSLVITEEEQIDSATSYQVVTSVPSPIWTYSNPLISTQSISKAFPTPFNVYANNTHLLAGANWFPKSAEAIDATTKTFWTVSDTKPVYTADEIITDSICVGDNHNVHNIIHDQYYGSILIGDATYVEINQPATTPSYTEYMASWAGASKCIQASVNPTTYGKLWKCELTYITFPTY